MEGVCSEEQGACQGQLQSDAEGKSTGALDPLGYTTAATIYRAERNLRWLSIAQNLLLQMLLDPGAD